MTTKQEFEALEIHLNYSKSSRPDKVHIGLVQLSTDHSLEVDWTKLSGSSAMVFSSRVYYSSVMTPKALNDISQGITAAADLIAVGLPIDDSSSRHSGNQSLGSSKSRFSTPEYRKNFNFFALSNRSQLSALSGIACRRI